MTSERRSSPRIRILGTLHGYIVPLDVPVSVSEIGLGGMGIQTEIPFPVGTSHAFQLTLGDGSVVSLTGWVVHCRKMTEEGGERYLIGIRFTDNVPDAVADLVDRLT